MKRAVTWVLLVALIGLAACSPKAPQDTPSPAPAPVPPLSGKDVFRSDKYHLAVRIPPNWGIAEGPEHITTPFVGQVAFNSWGENGFWSHEVRTENGSSYNVETVLSQMQQGGAYIVLITLDRPLFGANPTEYQLNDLSGLLKPQDWRSTTWYSTFFYKWGTGMYLQVTCSPNASDATVAEINSILESWQFDNRP